MSPITIRTASAADAGAISALIERTVRVSNAPDYPPHVIELIVANFTPEWIVRKMTERDVFVAVLGEVIVGTVSLGGDKLHSLFVKPDCQGRGIGRQLVAYLERHATGKGIAILRVSSSITAKPFYEKLGYQHLAFEPRDNGSTYQMSKVLSL